MAPPLMPKATAVWLVDNTSLTFEQIAEYCGLHRLEVQGIADGEVAVGIQGLDPIGNSQLTWTSTEDLMAAKSLAKMLSLPLHIMDWSGRQPHSASKMEQLLDQYGFKYHTYGSSDGLLRELEGGIPSYPILHLGGYSPAFTNMKLWENCIQTLPTTG